MSKSPAKESKPKDSSNPTYAIRFGLGAIKAVGFQMMEEAVKERELNGKFKDIYDFATRLDPKSINKKSIEALAKSGAFDSITSNRRQISESFEILSNYANEAKEEANSNQMNLFGSISEENSRPALKNTSSWNKSQKLKYEFEAFGFFLNEHPIDDKITDLKLRGIVFSPKIEEDDLGDNTIVNMAGVVASSKHRSGSRGRFAYLNISDPFGIFEATIFDEALITANRDLLEDGSEIVIECLIRKDDGGTRIMVKNVFRIEDFIKDNQPAEKEFEKIKKLPARKFDNKNSRNNFDDSAKNNEKVNIDNKPLVTQSESKNKPVEFTKNNRQDLSKDLAPSSKMISIEDKKIARVDIKITDQKALLPLKTVINQKISDAGNAEIYLIACDNYQQEKNIKLANKFKILDIDLFRLKNLHPNIILHSVKYSEN